MKQKRFKLKGQLRTDDTIQLTGQLNTQQEEILSGIMNAYPTVARAYWGQIQGEISNQEDLGEQLDSKQDIIEDLDVIRQGSVAGLTALQANDPVSLLENDAGYLTQHQDISGLATKEEVAAKQDQLVSGETIKTINQQSVLGSGDIEIRGVSDWNQLENKPFNTIDNQTLIVSDGMMRVNTTDSAEQDNTRPITSSGVHTIVGNIDALLELI